MEAKNDYHHSHVTITIIIIVSIHLPRPQYNWTQIKGTKGKKSTCKTQDAHDKMDFSNTTIIILKT